MPYHAQRLIVEWVRIYSATNSIIVLDQEELTYLVTLIINSYMDSKVVDKALIIDTIEHDRMSYYEDDLVYYLCDRLNGLLNDTLGDNTTVVDIVVKASTTMINTLCIILTVNITLKDVYELN